MPPTRRRSSLNCLARMPIADLWRTLRGTFEQPVRSRRVCRTRFGGPLDRMWITGGGHRSDHALPGRREPPWDNSPRCPSRMPWFNHLDAPMGAVGQPATLWIVPLGFSAIALYSLFSRDEGFLSGSFYLVSFVWIGLAHRRGMSLWFLPLVSTAYVVPMWVDGDLHRGFGVASVTFVVPCCIVVGETVAWVSERLRGSEAALADVEARFRSAFEHAPIGMGMATVDGSLIRVNQAFADVIGRTPADLEGIFLRDLTHGEDQDSNLAEIQACIEGETSLYQVEKRYQHSDGHYVWVNISASCVRDSNGRAQYLIGQLEDISERRELQARLTHAAVHDLLTGVPNRVLFMDRLELALERRSRGHEMIAVMFMDLDHFKLINDSLGHDAGDRLLKSVADRLTGALRTSDTVARFGGDEFTVLCEVTGESNAIEIAERLVKAMEQPLATSASEVFVSACIGIALSVSGNETASELLRNADIAMYRAKTIGPGHVEVFGVGEEVTNIQQLRTSSDLHRVMEREEFGALLPAGGRPEVHCTAWG